jgi:thiamine-phosphate pyrophosphorylase
VFWIFSWQSIGSVRARGLNVSSVNKSQGRGLLCYVTDGHSQSAIGSAERQETLLRKLALARNAGLDWIQIREKDLSGRKYALLTREVLGPAAKSSSGNPVKPRILVNDRLDIALSEGAGGVHLGENSLPLRETKRLVEAHGRTHDFLVGVSCHSLLAAQSAAMGGADYLFFGPIFDTPSKAAFGAPQGLGRLAEVCRAVTIPVLAIGGITLANSSSCFSAGAAGIAAIRLFEQAPDISSMVQSLRSLKR